MLDHVQDVSNARTPTEDESHDDRWQPVRPVPKTEEADEANSDGCESQFHLETAVQRPADARSDLVRVDDVAEESTHDAEPAREADNVSCNDLYDGFFSFNIARLVEMHTDGNNGYYDLGIKVEA